jgi:hypothetical protein
MNCDPGVSMFFGNRSLVEIRRTSSRLLQVVGFSSSQTSGPRSICTRSVTGHLNNQPRENWAERRQSDCREAPSSESWEEKLLRVRPPSVDGLGAYQTWRLALGSFAHLKRIAVCKVRWDIAVVGERNIRAFLSQLDVVSVVFESMRKQTGSAIFTARHYGKQHGTPPKRSRISPIL